MHTRTLIKTELNGVPVTINKDGSATIGAVKLNAAQFLDLWYVTRKIADELERAACELDRRIAGDVDDGYCAALNKLN